MFNHVKQQKQSNMWAGGTRRLVVVYLGWVDGWLKGLWELGLVVRLIADWDAHLNHVRVLLYHTHTHIPNRKRISPKPLPMRIKICPCPNPNRGTPHGLTGIGSPLIPLSMTLRHHRSFFLKKKSSNFAYMLRKLCRSTPLGVQERSQKKVMRG